MQSAIFKGLTWRNRWPLIAILMALAGAALFMRHSQNSEVTDVEGAATAIDGDSLFVGGREVRLTGIDAPEGQQVCRRGGAKWECGEAATQELAELIDGRSISCQGLDLDQHGRLLAVCTADGIDLNREMVQRGLAVSYGRYSSEEREAANSNRGLWAGEFERPRVWRRARGMSN